MSILGNGWPDSETSSIVDNQLLFSGDEMLINERTYTTASRSTTVETTFIYNGVDIALVLWYNNTGYIRYILSPQGLSIIRVYNNNESVLRTYIFGATDEITPPAIGDTVTLRAELYRTNIKCYLNAIAKPVFNFEQNTFSQGLFGIYGTDGAKCTSFTIKSNNISDWTRHLEEGCYIANDGNGIRFDNASSVFSYISQSVASEIGQSYTISVPYRGNIYIEAYDGTSVIASESCTSDADDMLVISFTATSSETEIRIGTKTAGKSLVYAPQIENKAFATSVTDGTRERSTLSFPAAKIDTSVGGLSLWVSPLHAYASGTLPIFYYNASFNMVYTAGNFTLTYGSATLSVPYTLVAGTSYHIIVTWINGNKIEINIYDETNGDTDKSLVIVSQSVPRSYAVLIGCTSDATGNASIDTLVVYAGEISVDAMKAYRTETPEENNRIVISTDFSSGTLSFSRNRITVPNPKPATPIIVEDETGTIYDRVYFIDSGRYVVYNKLKVSNSGPLTFKVPHSDLLEVRAYSSTKEYHDITISGNLITVSDLAQEAHSAVDSELTGYGNMSFSGIYSNWLTGYPVTVKRFISTGTYEEVDSSEYTINYPTGSILFKSPQSSQFIASYTYTNIPEITIQYTPRNVYCASYSKETGGYEILLSNVEGKKIYVTYENDYGADTKFVSTIEANPFKAANNNGFIYVTGKPISVTTLDAKVTPDSIVADGNQVATITIDCLGEKGVPTSNASLSVTLANGTKYGRIEKYISEEEQEYLDAVEAFKLTQEYTGEDSVIKKFGYFVTDEHISGRYIYKFYVNNISAGGTFVEKVIITDGKSGIGTEVPIRIVSKS